MNQEIRVTRWTLLVVMIIGAITLLFILVKGTDASQPIYSCTQAHAEGVYNIQKGSKLYRASLDRDHDGVACE